VGSIRPRPHPVTFLKIVGRVHKLGRRVLAKVAIKKLYEHAELAACAIDRHDRSGNIQSDDRGQPVSDHLRPKLVHESARGLLKEIGMSRDQEWMLDTFRAAHQPFRL
jgi:hypothetical protein